MTALRLVFMGTPDFAVPALAALIEAGHDVVCVYTQPPRPAGRGRKTRPSPVQAFAEQRGIEVRTPRTLREPDVQSAFARLEADCAVVAAYGLILPAPILEAPRLGCLNIHASLLPRWRGAAPIQRAIMAGDTETGVTIMLMDEGLDTGAMLLSKRIAIDGETTAETLHDSLSDMGAALIVEALAEVAEGRIQPTPQPEDGVTYAAKITPDDGRLDWSLPAPVLERVIRALTPRPGAWFVHGGERIRVLAAEFADAPPVSLPGLVLDEHLTIACGNGALRCLRVQRQGKAAMETEAFLRGFDIGPGTQLDLP
jgi:methionyl-tRNA formyltransferase